MAPQCRSHYGPAFSGGPEMPFIELGRKAMQRRAFVAGGAAAAAWSPAGWAQQLKKPQRIVHLSPVSSTTQAETTHKLLRELGYVEGFNIHVDFRNAGGDVDALPALA